ncbi:hypothetical protein E2F46_02180 [Luteimonas aestuarii]|uniref:Uncharacterized protein n=1 Tax=Luteimonas aestuarii TaxID=453837 RepID=A0A4V3AMZ7_9GAMM|nr:hypothetical protein [Luteimonas aestuarii]TDK28695.1 hypothetical protein E2F46_02180 [Luteimonas aestuarii]
MPITRAKATALLNQREMALYDDSRANAIRELDEKALSVRISRARDLRDRARDLVQRQKLSSRDRTGNKRGASGVANQRSKDKVELTTDILRRFEAQLDKVADANTGTGKKAAKKNAKKAAKTPARKSASRRSDRRDARKATRDATRSAKAAKPAAKKSPARKTAAGKTTKAATGKAADRKTKSAATKATVAKKASAKTTEKKRSAAAKPAPARKAAARTAATKSPVAKAARKKAGKSARKTATTKPLTPRQALKRTQSLLKAKQERDRAPKPWESLDGGASAPGQPGYQSGAAARRAQELHAGEARMPAIKGSISTRDRINQGKRDSRNSG